MSPFSTCAEHCCSDGCLGIQAAINKLIHCTETACLLSGTSSSGLFASPTQLSTTQPAYFHSLLKHYVPSHTLHSSDSNLLFVPVSVQVSVLVVFPLLLPPYGIPFLWTFALVPSYTHSFHCQKFLVYPSFTVSLVPECRANHKRCHVPITSSEQIGKPQVWKQLWSFYVTRPFMVSLWIATLHCNLHTSCMSLLIRL